MSLINRMLQELDRRSAISASSGSLPPQHVRPLARERGFAKSVGHIAASVLVVATASAGWIAYESRPMWHAEAEAASSAEREARTRPVIAKAQPEPRPAAEQE